jgi:hypothetical protein
MAMTRVHEQICVHCKKGNGAFSRVTYEGAPDGGVPVHSDCVVAFFKAIDARGPFWKEP